MSRRRFSSESGDARVVIITTGGTIVQKFDDQIGGYVPKTSGIELIESISSKINLEKIDLIEFSLIDSRAIDLKFLYDLSSLVQRKIQDDAVDGIVIIHGKCLGLFVATFRFTNGLIIRFFIQIPVYLSCSQFYMI